MRLTPVQDVGLLTMMSMCNNARSFWKHLVVIGARVPLIVADILLIYITCTKLNGRDAWRDIGQSKRLSLSDVLFRDGKFLVTVVRNGHSLNGHSTQELYILCTS